MDERTGPHMEHMQGEHLLEVSQRTVVQRITNTFYLHELCIFYTYFREKVLLNQHKLCIFHDKMQGFCLCKEP